MQRRDRGRHLRTGAVLIPALLAGLVPAALASNSNPLLAGGPGHPGLLRPPGAALVLPPSAHLNYYGGRVVSNLRVVQVLYGSGNYLPNVVNTTSPSLATFYQGVLNSAYVDWLTEYDTTIAAFGGGPGTNQIIGRGSFVSQVTISPSAANDGSTIDDLQIQSELAAQISAGHLPTPTSDARGNSNTYYAVFFPHGKTITLFGTSSCVAFCAYHGTIASVGGHEVYYGVHPDMQAGSGCENACGSAPTAFGNYTSVAAHEMVEAITDPEVGVATALAAPLAWYDPSNNNGEIGDICNGLQGTIVGSDNVTYTVQREWSNVANACIVSRPSAPTPTPTHTGRPLERTRTPTGPTRTRTPTSTPTPGPICPQNDLGSMLPASVSGSTVGGPNQISASSCGGGNTAPDATFLYTAPVTGAYTIDTCGSAFDTVLSVRAGSCAGAELPAGCNDDDAACVANGLNSRVTVDLTGGQQVVIVVDGFDNPSDSGDFVLHIGGPATPTPTHTPTSTPSRLPTHTPTHTPTVGNSALTPTSTATTTRTCTPTTTVSATPTSTVPGTPTASPAATTAPSPSVDLGDAVGRPGGVACVAATLTSGTLHIGAAGNEIGFDAGAFAFSGCVLNPAVGSGSGGDEHLVSAAVGSGLYRVGVLGSTPAIIPDGPLYTCRFAVAADAAAGTFVLSNIPTATDAAGNDLSGIGGTSGQIIVTTCSGDCNGDGVVSIGEVLKCVNLFLGEPLCNPAQPEADCPVADVNNDGGVSIGEAMQCVERFLSGCHP